MANRNVYDMDKQKVALVLSMGGARGIAHIGVIEDYFVTTLRLLPLQEVPWEQWWEQCMLQEKWKNVKNGCIVGTNAKCGNWRILP